MVGLWLLDPHDKGPRFSSLNIKRVTLNITFSDDGVVIVAEFSLSNLESGTSENGFKSKNENARIRNLYVKTA